MDPLILLLALPPLASVMDVLEWLAQVPQSILQAYQDLIRWAADSVHTLFKEYGYLAVFVGTLSENTLFVGLIVPGSLVIILAGIAAHDGSFSAPLALVIGVAGTIIGDTISYCLGRFGWARLGFLRKMTEQVREPILSRGAAFVLTYHFAGYTRVIGPAAAGLLGMPFRKWAPADYGGAVLWVTCYIAIGYALGIAGVTLDSTDEYFRYLEWLLLGLVLIYGYHMYNVAMKAYEDHMRRQEDERRAVEAGTD
jgi:membrane protein DedA with SNARE-associated domain